MDGSVALKWLLESDKPWQVLAGISVFLKT
jgi:hypothetical protein